MKITNTINTVPDDTERSGQPTTVDVSSHWTYNDRVNIAFGPVTVTVLADDLKRAVDNATNHK